MRQATTASGASTIRHTTLSITTIIAGASVAASFSTSRKPAANRGAAQSWASWPGFTSWIPGRTISSMPANPAAIARMRLTWMDSAKNSTAPMVVKIGAV